MQARRWVWTVRYGRYLAAKAIGGTVGLIAGLFFGGILSPPSAWVLALTTLAGIATGGVTQYWLETRSFGQGWRVWCALTGAATGTLVGGVVGGLAVLYGALYAAAVSGFPATTMVALEVGAINLFAGAFIGLWIGWRVNQY